MELGIHNKELKGYLGNLNGLLETYPKTDYKTVRHDN